MIKFFSFIKEYWFGLLISFILLVGFLFFLLILLAPRYDMQRRGFIPCTEALAQNLQSCPQEGKYRCILEGIMQNSWCDAKVIGSGFKLWLGGKQPAPWSNYIFKPELPSGENPKDELDDEFYAPGNHPELDLLKLQQLSDIIDKNNAELEKRQEEITEGPVEKQPEEKEDKNDGK